MKQILFKLFGTNAVKVNGILLDGKELKWDMYSVEGRDVLECFIE